MLKLLLITPFLAGFLVRQVPKMDNSFTTKEKRVDYMSRNMANYCLRESVYSGIKQHVNYEAAEIDEYLCYGGGDLITIKMSENSAFVFMFHDVGKGLVNVTYYTYKYGEIDKASIVSKNIQKLRIFPQNNIFTEELIAGPVKFILENKTVYKTAICSGLEVTLYDFDVSKKRYDDMLKRK